MTIGIVSYGAYVPRYRIKIEEIARLWGDNAEALKNGLMVYEKSVPDIDEDAATIAVEAARYAMARSGVDPRQDRGGIHWFGESSLCRKANKHNCRPGYRSDPRYDCSRLRIRM